MLITGVKLQNFRSYKNQAFEFEPGVNIIVGPNASGKTNLLEAVYVAARGKSFRTGDKNLVAYKRPWARIDMMLAKQQRTIKLMAGPPTTKQFEMSGHKHARMRSQDKLPVVLFTPEDLRGLSGSPRSRRQLIDNLVDTMFLTGPTVNSRYQRALTQRNHLLKQSQPDPDELFVWAVRLGELGGELAGLRHKAVAKLNARASRIYSQLVGRPQKVKFSYLSDLGSSRQYRHNLDRHLQGGSDLKTGVTTRGPHRDDIKVEIDGHDSQTSASRGELRTLVLVAKIVEINTIEDRSKIKPILLLDDVFSELDGARRQKLSKLLVKYQTIITTTDADAVVEHFIKQDLGKPILVGN